MSGGTSAPLPVGFRSQSEDARKVFSGAYSSFPAILQEYMALTAANQLPSLVTNKIADINSGLARRTRSSEGWTPLDMIAASGPYGSGRERTAKHELGHYLVENLFAGAPPGTTDSVLDRLAEVGRHTSGFNQAVDEAYQGGLGGASAVTSLRGDPRSTTALSSVPVFSFESDKEPVPPPMHEYFASQFYAPGGVMPRTGRDAKGKKFDAKDLLESLALYQMYGP